MNRDFTQEQHIFRDSYRSFLEAEIKPNMKRWEQAGIVDREAFEKAGKHGFLLTWADEKYGGLGISDFRFEQIMIEEQSRAGVGSWYATLHSRLVAPYLENFGTEEQKDRFLPACVRGECILAIAMTEPGAGSDLAGMQTSLSDAGDHYLLSGSKTYISNGINADLVIVAAKNPVSDSKHAMSLVLVERGMEGFERGNNLKKIGQHAQDTAELFFDQVKIPKNNLLGIENKGFYQLMKGLAEERLIGAVGYVSNARHAIDITRDFVMQREVFGKPLSEMQNTQFKLAEMDAEITMLEVFIDRLVVEHNQGNLSSNMAAKAKMLGSEAEWKVIDQCLQLHGGAGYMKDYEIGNMFCDARVSRIYAGSSEIMRYIIGRDVFSDKYHSNLR